MSRTGYVSGGPDMESAQYFCLHACYLTMMRTRTPGSRKTFSSKINILRVTVSQWFDCVSDVVCQNTFLSPRPNLFAPESPKIRHWWLLAQFWNIVCWPLLALIQLEKIWPHPNDPVPDGHEGETKKKSKKTANLRDKRGPTKCCLTFSCTMHFPYQG